MDFITNKKGNRFLAHNGFVYKLNKTAQYTYWKCIRNDREKCMGRLIVEGNKVTEKNVHNHVQETAPPIIDPSTTTPVYIKEEHISDSETCNGFNEDFPVDILNSINEPSRLSSTERLPTSTYTHFPVHTLASSSSAAVPPVSTRTSTPDTVANEEVRRGTKRKEREEMTESFASGTGTVKKEADNVGTFCSYIKAELTKMPEPDAEELLEEILLVLVKKKKEIRGRLQK